MLKRSHFIPGALLSLWFAASVSAGLIQFSNDPDGWHGAVGEHNFVDFMGFPAGTPITKQYSDLGITFTTFTPIANAPAYSDGWGVSAPHGVRILFDTPHHAIAVDHLGVVSFALFLEGALVELMEGWFTYPDPGVHFSGIISSHAFDEVYMFKPQPPFSNNVISLDNLYWGMPVPAPGALGLFALAAIGARRRRR